MKKDKWGFDEVSTAEFYRLGGGGGSYPGRIAKKICDLHAEQESLEQQQEPTPSRQAQLKAKAKRSRNSE